MATRNHEIISGLKDAVRYASGAHSGVVERKVRVVDPLNIKGLRARLGLTQGKFAAKYSFTLSSVRNWEQGTRKPNKVAENFLRVLSRSPETVEAALAA